MTTSTTAGTNGNGQNFAGPDIAAIVADPSGSRLDELYQWMDAAKAELGGANSRAAWHNELFDTAIGGLADLVRMSPHDEMERMVAAQLVAAHAATMDCYRRSRTTNLEQRRENLSHANKLTRAFAILLGALHRNRDKLDDNGGTRPAPSGGDAPGRPDASPHLAAGGVSHTSETVAREKSEEQPLAGTQHAKSEEQPHAMPGGAPCAPMTPPTKVPSVAAPSVTPAARFGAPARARANSAEQPHATATGRAFAPGPGTEAKGGVTHASRPGGRAAMRGPLQQRRAKSEE